MIYLQIAVSTSIESDSSLTGFTRDQIILGLGFRVKHCNVFDLFTRDLPQSSVTSNNFAVPISCPSFNQYM